ncbi:MAG: Xaa-Pro peptidase family protein [Anaerolineae bacterium]
MKTDIDGLMAQRGIDAMVIMGESVGNHALRYMTGGAKVSHAMVVKKRGEPALLICNPMEREEAARSGLTVTTTNDYDYPALVNETRSYFEAEMRLLATIFERHDITGTVSFYGVADPGRAYLLLSRLAQLVPTITVTGEPETSLFDEAYATKSAEELELLRDAARRTNAVFAETVDFIRGHAVGDGLLLKEDGAPLTIGDVRQFARMRLMAHGLEEEGPMILAIGRDGGIPHSRGEDSDPVALGRSIVFDLFPRVIETGYFHDMTRTFCLAYAPPEVERAYQQVMQAFNAVIDSLRVGEPTATYQNIVCDVFEEHGHPTPRSKPGTVEGYVHSVGHGLGLQIHSRPRFSTISQEVVQVGHVFTVEPGLYYPDQGFGVRVEDTVYIDEDGQVQSLTPFSKDLVIPVG